MLSTWNQHNEITILSVVCSHGWWPAICRLNRSDVQAFGACMVVTKHSMLSGDTITKMSVVLTTVGLAQSFHSTICLHGK